MRYIYFLLHAFYAIDSNFLFISFFCSTNFYFKQYNSCVTHKIHHKVVSYRQKKNNNGASIFKSFSKSWNSKILHWNWKVCYTKATKIAKNGEKMWYLQKLLYACISPPSRYANIPWFTTSEYWIQYFTLSRLKQVYVRCAFKMRYAHKVLIVISITTHNELFLH